MFFKNVFKIYRKLYFDRVETALYSKKNAVNDFFGGWKEEDLDLLNQYKSGESVLPKYGEIVDWLGVRTLASLHDWLPIPKSGSISIPGLPVPDDQVHAETIEYVSLIISIRRAISSGKKTFTAIELGASYAPWAVAAGVIALREGFKEINLMAVEANLEMIPSIKDHAGRNELVGAVDLVAIHGAVYTNDEDVYFPKVDVTNDNGAQVSSKALTNDYRGLEMDYQRVKGYSLKTLSTKYERIDFLHMDVQGAEIMLLNDLSFLGVLNKKVVTFFLATQSRFIEGVALEKLSALGWVLIRERPTVYRQNDRTKDVNGWTLRDGGQLWLNPKLSDSYCD
jgi:FkbM family methyltransferase